MLDMKKIVLTMMLAVMAVFNASAQTMLEQTVLFSNGATTVAESQMDGLEMVAEYMKNHPQQKIIVAGFCAQGTPAQQINNICEARAKAVKQILVNRFHVASDRLSTLGVGVSTRFKVKEQNEVVSFFK